MRAAFMAFALGAALACAAAPLIAAPTEQAQSGQAVVIDNFVFTPARLTIKAGTTVTWTNRDDIPHTVAAKDRLFKSKAMDTDDAFSFTFTKPGEYDYFCSLHPHMTGTIVVEGPAGNAATP